MADYISKNEVLNLIMHNDKVCHYADERYENVVYATACRISDVVANMPAADVQPVRHGRWIPQGDDMWLCSNCKKNIIYSEHGSDRTEKQRYCCRCGARMDGGIDG